MTSRGSSQPLPGQIGPYEILEEIGRGGMGVVYLALDPRLERRVAIKTLSEELSRDREWSARFGREARLLASLNHPNIATIHSLEREGDLEYLTMELIPGRSLEVTIQSGSLSLPDALSIGRQIARGLEAAHGAGVIHRDLKPLNVMITPESHAKMLDFGLATRASTAPADGRASGVDDRSVVVQDSDCGLESDDATAVISGGIETAPGSGEGPGSGSGSGPRRVSATTGAGTPGYMSPEQIRGEDLDARTDLWAFGCVLYESLSGKRAFRGASAQERIRSTLRGVVDLEGLPPITPQAIRELIHSCLQTDREARLNSATEARELLESVLAQRSWESAVTAPGDPEGRTTGRAAVPHNLPSEVTRLVGRAREVQQVRALLESERLLTLTGVGGGGKTRLAIRVGTESLERYPDGVWLVELAPVAEGTGVPRAVAKSLGIAESAGQSLGEAISVHVSKRSLLLILDNCEHVVPATAELAGALLAAAPQLTILATSREVLGLPGESAFQVPPLQVPPPRVPTTGTPSSAPLSFEAAAATESVQLFAQRAGQVRPDFRIRPENIEEIAGICRRLEGIPLAIELAAARTKALSLSEISRRLDDRFRLLKASSRSALPQHQTLEALIDWSHANLTASEQRLFRRLSIFRGGWTLEAAESVCPDADLEEWEILDAVTRLLDKSLVVFAAAGGPEAGGMPGAMHPAAPRYRMLEMVREYAQARRLDSDDAGPVGERFVSYFTALADAGAQHLTGPAQPEWLGKLDAEIDNMRAAIARTLEADDPLPALRITGPMLRYWMIRAQWREGRALLERAIAMPGAEAFVNPFGTVLNGLGSCCYQLNDLEAAARHYQRAVDGYLATAERRRAGPPLVNLGNVYRLRGDLDAAVASLTESLRCFEETDQWMIGAVQANLGGITLSREQYEESRTHSEAAIAIFRSLGDRVHTAMSVMNLGLVAYRQERLAEAAELLQECATIFEELGDRNIGVNAQVNLGIVRLAAGAEEAARSTFTKALRIAAETGSRENVAACLEGLSQISRSRGDEVRAVRLAGAAEAIRTRFELVRQPADQRQWDDEHRAIALEMGEDRFARLFADGRELDQEAAVALGLELEDGV